MTYLIAGISVGISIGFTLLALAEPQTATALAAGYLGLVVTLSAIRKAADG